MMKIKEKYVQTLPATKTLSVNHREQKKFESQYGSRQISDSLIGDAVYKKENMEGDILDESDT